MKMSVRGPIVFDRLNPSPYRLVHAHPTGGRLVSVPLVSR